MKNKSNQALSLFSDISSSPVTANTRQNSPSFLDYATELNAPLPYVKFLPEPDTILRSNLNFASGEIEYPATNNYIFQAFLQENNDALKSLICSVLHLNPCFVTSIEITNPITLGRFPDSKLFILDIHALLNNHTAINLEMQLINQKNWSERSLSYLCRSFDNLNSGNNYLEVKPAIHISFLNFTLFPDFPEFHATYRLINNKNMKIYTDKFAIHVIDLTCIKSATEEDILYETDKWASFFKAKTWEEIRMLSEKIPTLRSSAETLYQLNANEQIRETAYRYIRAEARERGLQEALTKQAQIIQEKTTEIEYLRTLLQQNNISTKINNTNS